jgi:uncharacterized SAM-binding protein YcdF (DUF218 family)
MFFELSKIFWALAQPLNLLFFLLGAAGFWLWRWPQSGRRVMLGLIIAAWVVGALPIGTWMVRGIEDTYARPAVMPERVDGIIILGGFVWSDISASRGYPHLASKSSRFAAFLKLAHQYPHAKLIFTGGSTNIFPPHNTETDVVRQVWTDAGLDPKRVIWEGKSRNTFENVQFSKELAQPQKGETWIMVTSAVHMPRSVMIFKKFDWDVIPYPVDYMTFAKTGEGSPTEFNFATNLWLLSQGLREAIGLWAYRTFGMAE